MQYNIASSSILKTILLLRTLTNMSSPVALFQLCSAIRVKWNSSRIINLSHYTVWWPWVYFKEQRITDEKSKQDSKVKGEPLRSIALSCSQVILWNTSWLWEKESSQNFLQAWQWSVQLGVSEPIITWRINEVGHSLGVYRQTETCG